MTLYQLPSRASIDQTTPGTTNKVDVGVTQLLGPTDNGVDPDDHYLQNATGSAISYVSGEVVGPHGTGHIILPGMARSAAGGGRLRRMGFLIRSTNDLTAVSFLVYIYQTHTSWGTLTDSAAYSVPSDADYRKLFDQMPIAMSFVRADDYGTMAKHTLFDSGPLDIGYQCPAGQTALLMHIVSGATFSLNDLDYINIRPDCMVD